MTQPLAFTFRNDQPDDFLAVVREVGQWLAEAGQELWQVDTLTADNLFDAYTRGNCYVMYAPEKGAPDNGGATGEKTTATPVPVAAFILQWKDPLFFDEVPDHTAGFIHKLAIHRAFAGRGLFTQILNFCQQECLRRGIRQIQLETDATRPPLLRFYERNGFRPTYQKTIVEFGQSFRCQYYVLMF